MSKKGQTRELKAPASCCDLLKRSLSGILSAVLVMSTSLYFTGDLSPVSTGAAAENTETKSISTLSIMTEDSVEPTCDYISHPENCWGATIINNEYVNCKVEYTDPNGKITSVIDEEAKIKIRGNTSASGKKKPYKVKLSSKQSFGTDSSSKTWVLLRDGTSLNFLFSNWAAEYCGSEWQPEFEYVNVYVNGDYRGCYILSQPVDQITKELDFDDTGFVVENDAYWWNAGDDYFKVDKQREQMGFTFKTPDADELDEQQTAAIKEKVSTGTASIVKGDNTEYLSYIDAANFASWYLAKDYMCNSDGGGSNMYWYAAGENEPLKLGPVWDYDNDYKSGASYWSPIHTNNINFGNYLFMKESFKKLYRNEFEKSKNICTDLNAYINEYIDTYGESLQESWDSDTKRWNGTAKSVETVKNTLLDFYTERNSWIDNSTSGWSLDFSDYYKAREGALAYIGSAYGNHDALEEALAVDVYALDFTQAELDETTAAIRAALAGVNTAGEVELTERKGAPYKINENSYVYDVSVPHVVINQVYGGKKKEAYSSDSFIELYNPTGEDINLKGWSLQYRSSIDGGDNKEWSKLELSGTIGSHSSYLVKCASVKDPEEGAFTIDSFDQSWNQVINNKGLSVVLLDSNSLIPADSGVYDNTASKPVISGYVDMFAVSGNDKEDGVPVSSETALYYEKAASGVQSKKSTVRRVGFRDTDDNSVEGDFEEVDYSFDSPRYRDYIRPRSGADGAWYAQDNVKPSFTVTLNSNGGSNLAPVTVEACKKIKTVEEPERKGFTFTGWFIDKECTVLCEFPLRPSDDMTLYAGWKSNAPEFMASSLVLSGQIGVNFYLDLSSLSDVERAASFMEFTVNGKTSTDPYDEKCINQSGEYYGFTCYVTSVEMADTINAVFHYGDGQTVTKDYSVLKYLEAIEENAESYDGKTLELIHAIADYGHYVQPFLADNNNWTVGSEHKEMKKFYKASYNYDSVKENVRKYQHSFDLGTSDIEEIKYSLSLNAETSINIYFDTISGYEGDIAVTVNGDPVTVVKQNDGRRRITISNISAHQLGDTYSVSITSDNGTASYSVSALSYVYAVISSNDFDELAKDAVSSLFAYYNATMEYRKGE